MFDDVTRGKRAAPAARRRAFAITSMFAHALVAALALATLRGRGAVRQPEPAIEVRFVPVARFRPPPPPLGQPGAQQTAPARPPPSNRKPPRTAMLAPKLAPAIAPSTQQPPLDAAPPVAPTPQAPADARGDGGAPEGAAGGAPGGAPGGVARAGKEEDEPVIGPSFDAAYLRNPAPGYPAAARRLKLEGTTILRVQVSAEGRPLSVAVETSSGAGLLDDAAVEAVQQWSFVPARQGNKRIAAEVNVPVRFRLSGAAQE